MGFRCAPQAAIRYCQDAPWRSLKVTAKPLHTTFCGPCRHRSGRPRGFTPLFPACHRIAEIRQRGSFSRAGCSSRHVPVQREAFLPPIAKARPIARGVKEPCITRLLSALFQTPIGGDSAHGRGIRKQRQCRFAHRQVDRYLHRADQPPGIHHSAHPDLRRSNVSGPTRNKNLRSETGWTSETGRGPPR
jgi:hypothetical protein